MPPIARLVPAAAAVVMLLTAGCGGSDEPPAPAQAAPSTEAPPSPSASAAPSTPAAREPNILVFTATGTAPITSLTYKLDDKSTKVSVRKLPWRLSVDVPADGLRHEWSLSIAHGKGSVEVRAIFNGKVVGTAVGRTSGTGTAGTGGSVLS